MPPHAATLPPRHAVKGIAKAGCDQKRAKWGREKTPAEASPTQKGEGGQSSKSQSKGFRRAAPDSREPGRRACGQRHEEARGQARKNDQSLAEARGERWREACGALTLTVGACAGVARGCTNRSTDERAKDKIEPVGCKDLEDTSSTLGRGAAAGRGFAPRHYEGQDEKYQQGGQTHMAVLSSNPMQCHYEFPKHCGTQYNEALTLVGQTMQAISAAGGSAPFDPNRRLASLLTIFRGQYAKLLATIRSLGFFPAVSPSPRIHGLCVWVCVRLCFSFVPDAAWGVGCWSGLEMWPSCGLPVVSVVFLWGLRDLHGQLLARSCMSCGRIWESSSAAIP